MKKTIKKIKPAELGLTERKRAEEALQSAKHFRALVEQSTDLVAVIDREGMCRYASPSFALVLGYTSEGLIGKDLFSLVHPDDLPDARRAVAIRVENPGVASDSMQVRLRHSDGSWRMHEAIGNNLLDDPTVQGIVITARDITARKRAEDALRESEERFRQVWETTSDAMALSDSEGIVLAANPAYFNLYGYTSEQVISRSFAIIFPEENRKWAVEQYKFVFASEVIPPMFESVVRRADGTERVVEARATFLTAAGRRTTMLSTIRDITERKRAEAALRESQEHYRKLADNFPNGTVSVYDRDLRMTFVAGGDLKKYNAKPESFIGKTFQELAPAETFAIAEPYLRAAFEGQTGSYETAYWEDRYYLVNVAPIQSADETINEILVVSQNLTERKRAEEASRQKDEHHRNAVESIFRFVPEGLLVFTENLSLVNQNKAFEEITQQYAARLGYTEPELAELIAEQVRRKILSGDTARTEIHIPKKRC